MPKPDTGHLASRLVTALVVGACIWFAIQSFGGGSGAADPFTAQKMAAYASALAAPDPAKARALFDAEIRKDPADPGVYGAISGACAKAEKYDLAVEYMERGLAACKNAPAGTRAEMYSFLSGYYTYVEKTKPQTRAIAAARSAVDLDPNSPITLNAYGYVLADNGVQLPEAERDIVQALELIRARNNSAQNRFLSLFGGAVAYEANDVEDSYGWVLYKEGRYPAAIGALEQAISDTPTEDLADPKKADPVRRMTAGVEYYHIGAAERAAGQTDRARRALETALSYYPASAEAKAELDALNRAAAHHPAAPPAGPVPGVSAPASHPRSAPAAAPPAKTPDRDAPSRGPVSASRAHHEAADALASAAGGSRPASGTPSPAPLRYARALVSAAGGSRP